MNNLIAEALNASKPEVAKPAVILTMAPSNLTTAVSNESWVQSLTDGGFEVTADVIEPVAPAVAQESQQEDHANATKVAAELTEQLKSILRNERNTGNIHVYLLDSVGLASADLNSQAALRSFAQRAVTDPKTVVLALQRERVSLEATDAEGQQAQTIEQANADAIQASLEDYANSFGIKVVYSPEQLTEVLGGGRGQTRAFVHVDEAAFFKQDQ